MLKVRVESLLTIPRFSHGRRVVVYDQLTPVAKHYNSKRSLDAIEYGQAHEKTLAGLEQRWRQQNETSDGNPELVELDARADELLGNLRNSIRDNGAGLPPKHPDRVRADKIVEELYPANLRDLIQQSFPDQHADMVVISGALSGDYAGAMADMGLTKKVERLVQITEEYGRLVRLLPPEKLDYKDLSAMRIEGHHRLAQLVFVAIGEAAADGDDARRWAFLGPIFRQITLVRQANKRRRKGDPEENQIEVPDADLDVVPELPEPPPEA